MILMRRLQVIIDLAAKAEFRIKPAVKVWKQTEWTVQFMKHHETQWYGRREIRTHDLCDLYARLLWKESYFTAIAWVLPSLQVQSLWPTCLWRLVQNLVFRFLSVLCHSPEQSRNLQEAVEYKNQRHLTLNVQELFFFVLFAKIKDLNVYCWLSHSCREENFKFRHLWTASHWEWNRRCRLMHT